MVIFGMMSSISKAATILQSDEWRSDRWTGLYHSCIDILAEKINNLTGRDMHFWFGDHKYRRSRVFLDFLCMDGDEVSNAIMCPTTQYTTGWCPKEHLSHLDDVYQLRDTADIRERVAQERKKLLQRDGRPRDRCREKKRYVNLEICLTCGWYTTKL